MKRLALLLFVAVSAFAQKPAPIELGFKPGRVYDFGGIDSVNAFNGNVIVNIPLGLQYPVTSSFSYGFKLTYNSKVWDYRQVDDYFNFSGSFMWANPNRRSNAGVGWRLSLGRLLPPSDPMSDYVEGSGGWVYEGPSGDEHAFSNLIQDGADTYTIDGSHLRMRTITSTSRVVDFPDGQQHLFVYEENAWRLRSIFGQFGNQVSCTYTYVTNVAGAPAGRVGVWKVMDTHGRQHTITFEYLNALRDSVDRGMVVKTIDLAGVGGAMRYELQYEVPLVAFGIYHNVPAWYPGAPSGTTTPFPLLKTITLPDQTTYTFNYKETFDGAGWSQGLLTSFTLPTRGTIAYTYQLYSLPSEDPCIQTGPPNTSPGVHLRTVNGDTWKYVPTLGPHAEMLPASNLRYDCDGNELDTERTPPVWPRHWARTSIVSPADPASAHTRTDHYFNVFAAYDFDLYGDPLQGGGLYGHPTTAGWSGLDSAQLAPPADASGVDSSAAHMAGGETLYLSEQTWGGCNASGDCSDGELLRSTYRRFTNVVGEFFVERVLLRERTLFHDDMGCEDDEPCFVETAHSEYDGAGHFLQTETTSNFPGIAGSMARTEYRTWTKAALRQAGKWLLNTFTEKSRTVDSETGRSTYCFDDSGRLTRTRVFAGSGRGANDLVTEFSYDGANLTDEKSYGGDLQPVDVESAALCTMLLPAKPQYWTRYSWTGGYGVLRTAQAIDPDSGAALPFESLDYTSDASGLVVTSRTPDDLATSYGYKRWGALEMISPPGEAATTYLYTPATSTANAKVTATTAAGTAAEVSTAYAYDAVGRHVRTERTLPGAGCSEQVVTYDALGRKRTESVWKTCGGTGGSTTYAYDSFGRPTKVTTPDGKSSSLAYTGARFVTRTSEVGAKNVSTREEYDVLGRLVNVTENAGADYGEVTTAYTYDVGDRLTSVTMPGDDGATQTRLFTYDNRGFLLSEQHPELGAGGNGTTNYTYDARGHVRTRATGSFGLTMDYDDAERLTSVRETGTQRELKTFVYDTFGQCTGTTCYGKLAAAARYHYDANLGDPATHQLAVTETYQYNAATGRPSRRDQTVGTIAGRFTGRTFFHTQTYDTLGNPLATAYPCPVIDGGCDFAQREFSVTNGYAKGTLTSVGSYATAITYQPSGIIDAITHGGGTLETWTADPHKMPRPRSITLKNSANTTLWNTGDYGYDGSGNITRIGNATYGYDVFGRLASTTTTAGAAYTSEYRTYDPFGNYLHSTYDFCGANPDGTRGPCGKTSVLPLELTGTTNHYAHLTYDGAGNVIRDASRRYSYDAAGMMTSYKRDAVDFRYLYTPSDERIAAVQRITGTDGVIRNRTTYTLRNFNNQLLSVWTTDPNSGALQWKEDEIWRGTALLARRAPTGLTHYALDHLGSPRAITNASGTLLGTQEFAPFGTGGTSNSGALQFTGHERDAANLLNGAGSMPDYMHARYYDVDGARFLSVDPASSWTPTLPQTWNRYSYALNNPLKIVDPDGRKNTVYYLQGFNVRETRRDLSRVERALPEGYTLKRIQFANEKDAVQILRNAEPTDYVVIQSHSSPRGMFLEGSGGSRLNAQEISAAVSDGSLPSGVILAGCGSAPIAQAVNAETGIMIVGGVGGIGINAQVNAIATLMNGVLTGQPAEAATAAANRAFEGDECPLGKYRCNGNFAVYPAATPSERQPNQ
jgi:RHS repeat-associated protein